MVYRQASRIASRRMPAIHPQAINPNRVPPGFQQVSMRVIMRSATCDEVNCDWFLNGKEGEDGGQPFRHPAGVMCGDFQRCPDPNCPCPQNRIQHKIADERFAPQYHVKTADGQGAVVQGEFMERLAEGVETTRRIRIDGV